MVMGSLAGIAYVPIPGWIKIMLVLGVISYGVWNMYQQLQWQAIGHDEDGWYLKNAEGKMPIILGEDSTVTSLVWVLRFKLPGKRFSQSCVIFKDAMSVSAYRQFIMRMKFFKNEPLNRLLQKYDPHAKILGFKQTPEA